MDLVDPWKPSSLEELIPQDYAGDKKQDLKYAFEDSGYYDGGLEVAFDNAYKNVIDYFGSYLNVTIHKKISADAADSFEDGSHDYIYLDGNHRYDFVLAGLERWSKKLSPEGVIVMNDIYVSEIGVKQSVGVVEALSTFLKLQDFYPIAMNMEPFGDLLITRKANKENIAIQLIQRLIRTAYQFFEVPDTLVNSIQHKIIRYQVESKEVFKEFLLFN